MGLPLPVFYFNQDKYGRLIVVDGRQRLSALFEYMDDEYALQNLNVMPQLNEKDFQNCPRLWPEDWKIIRFRHT